MTSEWQILVLGLMLGVRHAFDADHLVAVTTIVSDYKNPLRAVWVGISWGLGHTTTLFLVGGLLLLLNVRMPERLALGFEFLVGIVLVGLGVQTLSAFRRHKVHVHSHQHLQGGTEHRHFHLHEATPDHTHSHSATPDSLSKVLINDMVPGEHHAHYTRGRSPVFRLKSYVVGTVHGLAGSAALMLLVLANLQSKLTGLTYILLFGLGTVISMGLISIFISLPFSITGRFPGLHRGIQTAAGVFSIVFGAFLMYQIGITEGLFFGI